MNNNLTVGILSVLTIIFLVATMYVFMHANCPDTLRTVVSGSFTGFSSSLLLALRAAGPQNLPSVVPNSNDVTSPLK